MTDMVNDSFGAAEEQLEGELETVSVLSSSSCVLEQTIAAMEQCQLCFHPIHHHSFSPVSFLLSGSMRKCVGCDQRLKAVLGSSSDPSNQVVRCVSCGFYAHRSCAMETPSRPEDFSLMWNTKCPVNSETIKKMGRERNCESSGDNDEDSSISVSGAGDEVPLWMSERGDNVGPNVPELEPDSEVTVEGQAKPGEGNARVSPSAARALFKFLSPANLFVDSAKDAEPSKGTEAPVSISSDEEEEDEEIMLWTSDGPPPHFASENFLTGIHRHQAVDNNDDKDEEPHEPLHVATSTFDTVSRALQENIVAHFIRRPVIEKALSQDQDDALDAIQTRESRDQNEDDLRPALAEATIERTNTMDSTDSRVDVQALLTEVEPASPKPSTIAGMASETIAAAKESSSLRAKLGLASVAGGIAGGVAGLVLAGPAGAVIGVKCGQTAGLLGVVLEGSMTVGVFVAGVAAGGLTAHHFQQQQEKRILTIGEDGVKRKLLLVRPNVWIDPVWEGICNRARNSHSSNQRTFGLLLTSQSKQAALSKKERYQRDSDIVHTDESEIPTNDKVLLLVSRSLNDKESLPGHVYKCLIQDYRDRCNERGKDQSHEIVESKEAVEMKEFQNYTATESGDGQDDTPKRYESGDEMEPLVDAPAEDEKNLREAVGKFRGRRQDAHAVIKLVTATLLEVRPGFAASPAVTEMSAAAVESLVFGELYDSVFEEIVEETREVDKALTDKIHKFDEAHALTSTGVKDSGAVPRVSHAAVDALLMLPEAHSAVDKLRYCVQFLELISAHFSLLSKECLSADWLLKMVCQHIIVAKVPSLNAEITFLEDFARDEQLLRGKEGYALVTLQASLHFLNTSADFDRDIFGHDENEQQV